MAHHYYYVYNMTLATDPFCRHVEESGESGAFTVLLAVVEQVVKLLLALQLPELSLQDKINTYSCTYLITLIADVPLRELCSSLH